MELTWISADAFACCFDDKTIKMFQLDQPSPVKIYQDPGPVYAICWSREDDRWASCSGDGSIRVSNTRDGWGTQIKFDVTELVHWNLMNFI